MKIPLATIKINGQTVDLEISVDLEATRIEAIIALPKNYPDTVLGERYRDRNIFILAFSIYNKDRKDTEIEKYSERLRELLDAVETYYIFIHEYFFYPKMSNIEMTSEEKVAFGGLGKKVLCAMFNLISTKFPLNPEKTLVVLEASGNVRSTSDSDNREDEIMNMDKDSLIQLVENYNIIGLDGFTDMFKKQKDKALFSSNSWKDLPRKDLAKYLTYFIVNYEDNLILASYYYRNYGFDIVYDRSFSHILMATNVSTILEYCSKKKA
jgi:hypothetical protein